MNRRKPPAFRVFTTLDTAGLLDVSPIHHLRHEVTPAQSQIAWCGALPVVFDRWLAAWPVMALAATPRFERIGETRLEPTIGDHPCPLMRSQGRDASSVKTCPSSRFGSRRRLSRSSSALS